MDLHPVLKEDYYLLPDSGEEGDPYESTQVSILIASPAGIFGVYDMREVHEFKKFWAMGSGSALRPRRDARALRRRGLRRRPRRARRRSRLHVRPLVRPARLGLRVRRRRDRAHALAARPRGARRASAPDSAAFGDDFDAIGRSSRPTTPTPTSRRPTGRPSARCTARRPSRRRRAGVRGCARAGARRTRQRARRTSAPTPTPRRASSRPAPTSGPSGRRRRRRDERPRRLRGRARRPAPRRRRGPVDGGRRARAAEALLPRTRRAGDARPTDGRCASRSPARTDGPLRLEASPGRPPQSHVHARRDAPAGRPRHRRRRSPDGVGVVRILNSLGDARPHRGVGLGPRDAARHARVDPRPARHAGGRQHDRRARHHGPPRHRDGRTSGTSGRPRSARRASGTLARTRQPGRAVHVYRACRGPVGRWTASMGEGLAIGLDGMWPRAVVGSRWRACSGPSTGSGCRTPASVRIPTQRLTHVDGTPRETFSPGGSPSPP